MSKSDHAKIQVEFGCSNLYCINPFCKNSNSTSPHLDQISSLLTHTSPESNLFISQYFIHCEDNIKPKIKDFSSINPSDIIDLFSSPASLVIQLIHKSTKSLNFKRISALFNHISSLEKKILLPYHWLIPILSNYSLTQYTSLFIQKAIAIILLSPSISQLTEPSIPELIFNYVDSKSLKQLMNFYPQEEFSGIVKNFKKLVNLKFSINFFDFFINDFDYELKLFKLLYESNKANKRVKNKKFYIKCLNKEVNLKIDFHCWLEKKTSVFENSFVLDANSKSTYIEEEVKYVRKVYLSRFKLQENYMVIYVKRELALENALLQFGYFSYLVRPLKIKFLDEEGVDEGGLIKEFFELVFKKIFNVDYGMFSSYLDNRFFWFDLDAQELEGFYSLGQLIGLAFLNSVKVDLKFPKVFYKKITGRNVSVKDLEEFEPEIARGLKDLKEFEGNIEEVYCIYFVIETHKFGKTHFHELIPNGKTIAVNQRNKNEYINLYVNYILSSGIKNQYNHMIKGFNSVVKLETFKSLNSAELKLLLCGSPKFDIKDLEKSAKYEGYSKSSLNVTFMQISYFWKVIHELSIEKQKKFLAFVTGSSRIPLGGLEQVSITISKTSAGRDSLLTAHTCFNYLFLPDYGSIEIMRKMILMSIENFQGFGLM